MGLHGSLMARSDKENAIQDVVVAMAKLRGEQRTTLEAAPKGDSKANGRAERGVQSVEEQIRTIMLDLTDRLGEPRLNGQGPNAFS